VVRKRKIKRKSLEEVDWCDYFQRIQGVCPWSYRAWKNGTVDIVEWQGNIEDLDGYQARVYVHVHASPRLLNKWADKLNAQHSAYEFLWSHPRYKGDSTPLPCIIQQDRNQLKTIRDKIKHK